VHFKFFHYCIPSIQQRHSLKASNQNILSNKPPYTISNMQFSSILMALAFSATAFADLHYNAVCVDETSSGVSFSSIFTQQRALLTSIRTSTILPTQRQHADITLCEIRVTSGGIPAPIARWQVS
jgi:hypothetical protein